MSKAFEMWHEFLELPTMTTINHKSFFLSLFTSVSSKLWGPITNQVSIPTFQLWMIFKGPSIFMAMANWTSIFEYFVAVGTSRKTTHVLKRLNYLLYLLTTAGVTYLCDRWRILILMMNTGIVHNPKTMAGCWLSRTNQVLHMVKQTSLCSSIVVFLQLKCNIRQVQSLEIKELYSTTNKQNMQNIPYFAWADHW